MKRIFLFLVIFSSSFLLAGDATTKPVDPFIEQAKVLKFEDDAFKVVNFLLLDYVKTFTIVQDCSPETPVPNRNMYATRNFPAYVELLTKRYQEDKKYIDELMKIIEDKAATSKNLIYIKKTLELKQTIEGVDKNMKQLTKKSNVN